MADDKGDDEQVDWEKRADLLFRKKSVDAIKKWETKTREEISGKKRELRHLVGGKYRDFIDAADSIVRMAELTRHTSSCVSSIRSKWLSVSEFRQRLAYQPEVDESEVGEYRIAIQMKILMDAPEKVWSALEHNKFIQAAMVYRFAQFVHHRLQSASSKRVNTREIIDNHWTTMAQFSESIQQASARVLSSVDSPQQQTSAALAATHLLSQCSTATLLDRFLSARASAIADTRQSTSGGDNSKLQAELASDRPGVWEACYEQAFYRRVESLITDHLQQALGSAQSGIATAAARNPLGQPEQHLDVLDASYAIFRQHSLVSLLGIAPAAAMNANTAVGTAAAAAAAVLEDGHAHTDEAATGKTAFQVHMQRITGGANTWVLDATHAFEAQLQTLARHVAAYNQTDDPAAPATAGIAHHTSSSSGSGGHRTGSTSSASSTAAAATAKAVGYEALRARGDRLPFNLLADADNVRRFVHTHTHETISALCGSLDALAIRSDDTGQQDRFVDATRAVVLARIAHTLARSPAVSELLLCPVTSDTSAARARRFNRSDYTRARRKGTQQNTEFHRHLVSLQQRLDRIACQFLDTWLQWTLDAQLAQLRAGLFGLEWSDLGVEMAAWQEHDVTEQAEDGQAIKSTFRLPSQPSKVLLTCLTGTCAEFARTGLSTLPSDALVAAVNALYARIVQVYMDLFASAKGEEGADDDKTHQEQQGGASGTGDTPHSSPSSPSPSLAPHGLANASQNAYIQLLVDLRFLADVFAYSRDTAANDASIRGHDTLIQRCTDNIDPFDMNVYAPHLHRTRVSAYHRCATLLGYITQLKPMHEQARPSNSGSDRANLLSQAPVIRRFAPLPVAAKPSLVRLPDATGTLAQSDVRTSLAKTFIEAFADESADQNGMDSTEHAPHQQTVSSPSTPQTTASTQSGAVPSPRIVHMSVFDELAATPTTQS
ncbi:hypothetical protein PTSG_04534 [Salpingoeca rosetta]|uniref:Conserved oligomeric Golgi complex subunit 1 n=1 Tax=Salpingoeca rosetta (strain ATCC 50818 / BSB-021) TaxID=946362 RepID=F2U7Q2_SALR5|nr:uncharacterized protein PTSG_04534 [Salpingoeca rosetta]EGD72807.1 hypothetical protein PTSG_04534 [Salpingoeca rosetta]|eukprot:XP_004994630.1 hypothetical protein PTSG_04534 [Salpingoeca rosetta]